MTRPPAPALSPAEAATVARFDVAPVPPECDPELVETVARALWEADHDRTAWEDATEDGPDEYRRLAAAAIAAMPPSPEPFDLDAACEPVSRQPKSVRTFRAALAAPQTGSGQ